jgi:hypothetical protein
MANDDCRKIPAPDPHRPLTQARRALRRWAIAAGNDVLEATLIQAAVAGARGRTIPLIIHAEASRRDASTGIARAFIEVLRPPAQVVGSEERITYELRRQPTGQVRLSAVDLQRPLRCRLIVGRHLAAWNPGLDSGGNGSNKRRTAESRSTNAPGRPAHATFRRLKEPSIGSGHFSPAHKRMR